MSYTTDLSEGSRILGHAIGHACASYGDCVDDYTGILAVAMHGRHRASETAPTIYSDYVTATARDLIAQAESGRLDRDPVARSGWVGAATQILRELTRNA